MVNNFLARLLQHMLPRYCILCDDATQRDLDLCIACEADLPAIDSHSCPLCALATHSEHTPCGRCLRVSPSYSLTIAGWLYSYPIDQLISQFKHQKKLSHGRVLTEMLGHKIKSAYENQPLPDIITPTPLHWRRLWKRGFNQSELIAQRLAKQFNIPVCRNLKRSRNTDSQQGLSADIRRKNLKKAFRVTSASQFHNKIVAVVDDVVTTTATANEISQCLLAAGAKEVHIWCLARTPIN